MSVVIRDIAYDEAAFAELLADAEADGAAFLARLRHEWLSGGARFDRRGEFLLGAFVGGRLVGVGGISVDPYRPEEGLGRVRHLYVLRAERRQGIGRALCGRLVERGRRHHARLRLRTGSGEAARLYESFGFVSVHAPDETHRLAL